MRLQFESSIENIREINKSFSSGTMRICYAGRNRNGSFLSRESIERAIPTMFNCPVVCNYSVEDDSIGGHDMAVKRDASGEMRLIHLTEPVGVVPSGASYGWTTVTDDRGEEREYLTADVILWKRSNAFAKLSEDGVEGQSMEIAIDRGVMEEGVLRIEDFTFTAFCLLGEDHPPCFEDAALELFDRDRSRERFAEMMDEYKQLFTMSQPEKVVINEIKTEGGDEPLDEKNELLQEPEMTPDQLDFSVDEPQEETGAAQAVEEPAAEEAGQEAFALQGQIRDSLCEAVSAEQVETAWGQMPRYCMLDYDPDIPEVYCEDREDWKIYGFRYTMDGDAVSVDFNSKTRKKFAFVDFDEGEQTSLFASAFAKAAESTEQIKADYAELEGKYTASAQQLKDVMDELEELRAFRQNAEDTAARAAREDIFAQFSDLNGLEEFEALREQAGDFTLEELEEKCFAMRGRNVQAKFEAAPRAPKIMAHEEERKNDEPYGGLFVRYGVGQN